MIIRLIAALLLAISLAAPARAQDAATLQPILQNFLSSKFDDLEKGIQELAASGSPMAAQVLGAMGENRLFVRQSDKTVYIQDAAGGFLDAATGQPAAGVTAGDVKVVRVNNRIRRALEAGLGGLTLVSANPADRIKGAESVFNQPEASALPTVEKALAGETDASVKPALERALGALLIEFGETPAKKAEGATLLANYPSGEVKNKLEQARNALAADAPEELKDAIDTSLGSVEKRLYIFSFAESIFQGISLGSVLLLAAIGLAITFGVMGVINMAHGEMVMIGAYTTYVIQEFCRTSFPAGLEWSLVLAVPAAFLVAGLVGVVIERLLIRRLYGRPLETLLATWGLSLILQQAVRSIFGPSNRQVSTPSWMSGSFDVMGGLPIVLNRLTIVIFCMAVFLTLLAVIRYTRLGLEMRAVTQNRRMAASMGIRTAWVDALTFGLGSGIAGIAGVALSQIDNVSPNLGQSYIIDSFMVVVFGGVGNLWGTFTAALTLGIVNKFLEPAVGAVLAKILVLVAIILFIQKRPRGLFALKGRSVEA